MMHIGRLANIGKQAVVCAGSAIVMSAGGASPGQQDPCLSTTYDSIAIGMASAQQAVEAHKDMGASELPPQHGGREAGQGLNLPSSAGENLDVDTCQQHYLHNCLWAC